jgi:hypothetical protein
MAAITPIAATFIALFVASVHGDSSCKITPCNCSFTNIEILRNYIDETVNAAVAAVKTEVNNTISALNATVDERIAEFRTTIGAHDASILKLISQPGRYINIALISMKVRLLSAFQHCSLKKPKKEAKIVIILCYIAVPFCLLLHNINMQ